MDGVHLKALTAPLKIDSYFFPLIEYKAFPHKDPDGIPEPKLTQVKTSVKPISEDNREWYVSLDLKSNKNLEDNPVLFEYHLMAFGTFIWQADVDDPDFVAKVMTVSGASILYGALREEFRTISAKGPWGMHNLPTLRFDPIAEDSEDQPSEE